MTTPTSVIVAIWSLRSVPISMLILMFVFNSGSVRIPHPNLQFWFDAIAIIGIIGILCYWNQLKRLHWNGSFVVYLYIFIALILRNPYGIITATSAENMATIDYHSILNSMWVGVGILGVGLLVEILVFQLLQFKMWTWWAALLVSILYVCSIVFFFSGTLGIWSLLDVETKQIFKRHLRYCNRQVD